VPPGWRWRAHEARPLATGAHGLTLRTPAIAVRVRCARIGGLDGGSVAHVLLDAHE
jgi:hypothetical protein